MFSYIYSYLWCKSSKRNYIVWTSILQNKRFVLNGLTDKVMLHHT